MESFRDYKRTLSTECDPLPVTFAYENKRFMHRPPAVNVQFHVVSKRNGWRNRW